MDNQVTWRVILGFPLPLFLISTVGFLMIIKFDGPSFYLTKGQYELAERSFNSINKTELDRAPFLKLCKEYENSAKLSGSTKVSLKDAFWHNENYRRASWINIANVIFHEATGLNIILQYSNTILDDILGDSGGFTARQGTYVVGLVNFFASMMSVWTVNTFGRRTLLLVGHSGMSVAHFLIGIFIITNFNAGVLSGIALFLFIY